MVIGERIKQRREERGIKLSELARRAGVSKAYLSALEKGASKRPSADILYKIASALGTSVADLMGRTLQVAEEERQIPPGLYELALSENLSEEEINMLKSIKYRGKSPQTKDDWKFLYESIKRSVGR